MSTTRNVRARPSPQNYLLGAPSNIQDRVFNLLFSQDLERFASVSENHASAIQRYRARGPSSKAVAALGLLARWIEIAAQKLVAAMYRVLALHRKYPGGVPGANPFGAVAWPAANVSLGGVWEAKVWMRPAQRKYPTLSIDFFNKETNLWTGGQELRVLVNKGVYKLDHSKRFHMLEDREVLKGWMFRSTLKKAFTLYREHPLTA
jgi:hypothetical protein